VVSVEVSVTSKPNPIQPVDSTVIEPAEGAKVNTMRNVPEANALIFPLSLPKTPEG
jgi:hypothetical protein